MNYHYQARLMGQGDRLCHSSKLDSVTRLARYDQLKEAYLVRKVVRHFPKEAFYILALKRQQRFWNLNSDQADQKLIDQIADGMEFPGQTYVLLLNKHTKNIEKKLRPVVPTAIYRR